MANLKTVMVILGEQQDFEASVPSAVEKANGLINSVSTELWFLNGHHHAESVEWLRKLEWKTKILISDPDITYPSDEQIIDVLTILNRERKPTTIILPAGDRTNKLVAQLGLALGVGSLLNITNIKLENNRLLLRRPIYGGNLFGTFETSADLLICTLTVDKIDNGMINKFDGKSQLLVRGWPIARTPSTVRSEERKVKNQESSLGAADIFIVAGRGLGSRENGRELEELADLLGAEIGGTRPVIANGWLPRFRLVGISGVTVKPRICVVFGASGATPFIIGIEDSEKIIGINDEKTAMLFNSCDVGMIADCNQLIQIFRKNIISREKP